MHTRIEFGAKETRRTCAPLAKEWFNYKKKKPSRWRCAHCTVDGIIENCIREVVHTNNEVSGTVIMQYSYTIHKHHFECAACTIRYAHHNFHIAEAGSPTALPTDVRYQNSTAPTKPICSQTGRIVSERTGPNNDAASAPKPLSICAQMDNLFCQFAKITNLHYMQTSRRPDGEAIVRPTGSRTVQTERAHTQRHTHTPKQDYHRTAAKNPFSVRLAVTRLIKTSRTARATS